MPPTKIRSDYTVLAGVAQSFNRESSRTQRTLDVLHKNVDQLLNGNWVGQNATKFYQEMNADVFPTIKRLVEALGQAADMTKRISEIMKQAETEAAAVFRLDGAGGFQPGGNGDGGGGASGETGSGGSGTQGGGGSGNPIGQSSPIPPAPQPNAQEDSTTLYVLGNGTRLREDPDIPDDDPGANIITELDAGTAVQVIGTETVTADGHEWVQVQTEDGQTGWIARDLLGEAPPADTGDLSAAPLTDAYESGWGHGDSQYTVNTAFDVTTHYDPGAVIPAEVYNSLTPEQQATVTFNGTDYIANAPLDVVTASYSEGEVIDADTYNALSDVQKANVGAERLHPGVDISSSDSALTANAGGTIYMYQTWVDDDGVKHTELYDPDNPAEDREEFSHFAEFGNYLVMATPVGDETYYQVFGHLDSFDSDLSQGETVTAGTDLGTMGQTGNATGDHVHWEIRTDEAVTATTDTDGNVTGYDLTGDYYPETQAELDELYVGPGTFGQLLEAEAAETPEATDTSE